MEHETGFEGLDEILGTKFDDSVITNPPAKRTELVEMAGKEKSLEEERSFLEEQIAELIENAKDVSETLKGDLKIGQKSRAFEVYSTLSNTILNCIKEMHNITMEREKMKLEREKFEHKVSKGNQPNVNVKASLNLSSDDLFKLMEQARDKSSMNIIEPDYVVRSDEQPNNLNTSGSNDNVEVDNG